MRQNGESIGGRRGGLVAGLFAVAALVGIAVPASSAPLSQLPGFSQVDVYESTSGSRLWNLDAPDLTRQLSLGAGQYDFLGAVGIPEYYDAFFSDSAGNYNALGHFLTVECRFDYAFDAAGNIGQAELFWNNGVAQTEVANQVVHSVLLGTYKSPNTVPLAVDGNRNTATAMGNTVPGGPLLSLTLAFPSSYLSYVVPGPGSTADAGGGAGDIGGVSAQFGNVGSPGVLSAPYLQLSPDEIAGMIAGDAVPFDVLPQLGTDDIQIWDIAFDGTFDSAQFTVAYDPLTVSLGYSEEDLRMFHFYEGVWTVVSGVPDIETHTITFTTSSLSPFMIGVIPEPGTWAAALAALLAMGLVRRRRI